MTRILVALITTAFLAGPAFAQDQKKPRPKGGAPEAKKVEPKKKAEKKDPDVRKGDTRVDKKGAEDKRGGMDARKGDTRVDKKGADDKRGSLEDRKGAGGGKKPETKKPGAVGPGDKNASKGTPK